MIVERDGGYTLHCNGCGANVSLTAGVLADPFEFATRREAMALVHVNCHTFPTEQAARAAMKARRAEMFGNQRSAAR